MYVQSVDRMQMSGKARITPPWPAVSCGHSFDRVGVTLQNTIRRNGRRFGRGGRCPWMVIGTPAVDFVNIAHGARARVANDRKTWAAANDSHEISQHTYDSEHGGLRGDSKAWVECIHKKQEYTRVDDHTSVYICELKSLSRSRGY